jgi:hypothetical protein
MFKRRKKMFNQLPCISITPPKNSTVVLMFSVTPTKFSVPSTINMIRCKKEKAVIADSFYRGPEQIRTAVKGFADLCLATRPRNPVFLALPIRRLADMEPYFIRTRPLGSGCAKVGYLSDI